MINDKIFFDEKDPTGINYDTPFTVYGSYDGRLWSKSPAGDVKYYTQSADIINDLTTGGTTVPLSANQGKELQDNKEPADATILKQADVVDTLVSTSIIAPLSANQGKQLEDTKIATSAIVNDLTTGGVTAPLSAEQGVVLEDIKLALAGGTMTGALITPSVRQEASFHTDSIAWAQKICARRTGLLNSSVSNIFKFTRPSGGSSGIQLSSFGGVIEILSTERLSNNNQGSRIIQYPFVVYCRGTSGVSFEMYVGSPLFSDQVSLGAGWNTSFTFQLVNITNTSADLQVTCNLTSIATHSFMLFTILGSSVADNAVRMLTCEKI